MKKARCFDPRKKAWVHLQRKKEAKVEKEEIIKVRKETWTLRKSNLHEDLLQIVRVFRVQVVPFSGKSRAY